MQNNEYILLRHEMFANGFLNFINEFEEGYSEHPLSYYNVAKCLYNKVEAHLCPELSEDEDEAICLLMWMADENTHPEEIPMYGEDWDNLDIVMKRIGMYNEPD